MSTYDPTGTASPAQQRAAYVHGLENELASLERQPSPNQSRVNDVKSQLDKFARQPAQPSTEVAIPGPVGTPTSASSPPAPAPTRKPAKKAVKKAPAKKAASKPAGK